MNKVYLVIKCGPEWESILAVMSDPDEAERRVAEFERERLISKDVRDKLSYCSVQEWEVE